MKKAIVLLLALAVLGGAAFAEDAAYTLSGSASLIWGYDLNTKAHGFTNKADATLTVPFIAKQSSTHGEEAITGTITIKDFEYKMVDKISGTPAQTMTAGSITAKILFPSGMYLQIASAPEFLINNAETFQLLTADADWEDSKLVAPEITSAGGFGFGMDGDLSFVLNMGSTNKHTYTDTATYTLSGLLANNGTAPKVITADPDATTIVQYFSVGGTFVNFTNVTGGTIPVGAVYFTRTTVPAEDPTAFENDYMVGGDVSYKIGDLATVGANFIFGAFQRDYPTVGIGVYANATPVEGLDLAFGMDWDLTEEASAATKSNPMDFMFKADYTMADMFNASAGAYMALDTEVEDGNPLMNVMLRAGLLAVENLSFDLGVDMLDVLDTGKIEHGLMMIMTVNASYKAMMGEENYVKPYASFGLMPEYKIKKPAEVTVLGINTLNIGVEAKFFPLTTFTLDYTAGEFDPNKAYSGTTMGSEAGKDKGVITFTTTITY